MVSSMTSLFILLPFLTVAQHESDTRKTISWLVTVYSKNLFSQVGDNCIVFENFTASFGDLMVAN